MWDWRYYLQLAERLRPAQVEKDDEVARARSAISRAYYAAYNVTRDYMAENGHVVNAPGNSHKPYWDAIGSDSALSDDEREVGHQGRRLHSMRIYADYENAYVDPAWSEAGKEAKRKKQRDRLRTDSEAALIVAHKICALLKKPWPPSAKAAAAVAERRSRQVLFLRGQRLLRQSRSHNVRLRMQRAPSRCHCCRRAAVRALTNEH